MTDNQINKEVEDMITDWIKDMTMWLAERYEDGSDEEFELFETAFEVLLRENVKHLQAK